MNPQESIASADARIAEAREFLTIPSAESLEKCRTALAEAAVILEHVIQAGMAGWSPELVGSLRQLQIAARGLEAQLRHGSRFCTGWLQARLGTGYTERGTPVMMERAQGQIFEG